MKPVVLIRLAILALIVAWPENLRAQDNDKAVPANKWPLGKGVRCVAFSPDGARLAATLGEPKERGRVVLWDLASRKQLWSHAEDNGVPAVAFAPDGKTMAVGNYDNKATLLDVHTGRTLKVFEGHTNYLRAVAFSPDGKTLATGSWDQTVKLWDLTTGAVMETLNGPKSAIFTLAYSPKGRWLLASNGDVHIWDAARKENPVFGKARYPNGWAVFTDEDAFIANCNDATIRFCNIATGEQRVLCKRYGYRLAYSAKARTLAANAGRGHIDLIDFPPREAGTKEKERIQALLMQLDDDSYEVREKAGQEILTLGKLAEPELRRAAKESPSVEVRIRARRLHETVLDKSTATLTGHAGEVEGLAFSPSGLLLASGGRDGTVRRGM